MNRINSTLILKSNRVIGAKLVDSGLVSLRDLDGANEIFIERIRDGELANASLLKILLIDRKVISETDLIRFQLENCGIGAISFQYYKVNDEVLSGFDVDECMATWTLPFDLVGDTYFLASAYYLSDVVRQHWEEALAKPVVWYAASLVEIEEKIEEYRARTPVPEAEA